MRWQEEVTLTGYEMQWTVRYFFHMSRKWAIPTMTDQGCSSGIGTASGPDILNLTPGAMAYWKRKQGAWEVLMRKADSLFKKCNPSYDSPL